VTKGSDVYMQLGEHRALWGEHADCMCISQQGMHSQHCGSPDQANTNNAVP